MTVLNCLQPKLPDISCWSAKRDFPHGKCFEEVSRLLFLWLNTSEIATFWTDHNCSDAVYPWSRLFQSCLDHTFWVIFFTWEASVEMELCGMHLLRWQMNMKAFLPLQGNCVKATVQYMSDWCLFCLWQWWSSGSESGVWHHSWPKLAPTSLT